MIINIVKDQSKEEEEEIEMGVTFHMVPTVACQANLKGTISNSLWKSSQMDPKVIFSNDSIQLF